MEMTVRQMLGQKLIFGFHGTALSEEFKALIREYKIGNVILFLRNVESAEQLRRLCDEIQTLIREVTGYPAFIVIDQEGGMVSRLPLDAVNVPGAMALGAAGDPENAYRAGKLIGRDHFHVRVGTEETKADILATFIKQFYSGTPFIPREIILPQDIEEKEF